LASLYYFILKYFSFFLSFFISEWNIFSGPISIDQILDFYFFYFLHLDHGQRVNTWPGVVWWVG